MRCTVLLFAQLRDAVGRDSIAIDLFAGATVKDALHHIAESHPAIAQVPNHIATAVNERYASPTTILYEGDIIALIPPVSGG
jgi:molybdopterin converting factor subunit 1